MSVLPVYKICSACGKRYKFNPSVGDFGIICQYCVGKHSIKGMKKEEDTIMGDYVTENTGSENKIDRIREIIKSSNLLDQDKAQILQNILQMENQKINILITGATGCGKSSTINALFGTEVAKVGCTPDPETMDIEKYELNNLVLWDSPGLGDKIK